MSCARLIFFGLLALWGAGLVGAHFYLPELRSYAALGLALCLTLIGGLCHPATRWWAAGFSVPALVLICYLISDFLHWTSS